MSDSESSPAVVVYRMGQLEQTVKDGFKDHNEKLDKLVDNFATKHDVAVVSHRVATLEGDNKWKHRAVMSAVYAAAFLSLGSLIITLITKVK